MESSLKLPKGEIIKTQYYSVGSVLSYILTAKESSPYYWLYKVSDGKAVKLGRGTSPLELEDKFEIQKKLSRNRGGK